MPTSLLGLRVSWGTANSWTHRKRVKLKTWLPTGKLRCYYQQKGEKGTASILVARPMQNAGCARHGGPCMNKRHHDGSSHEAQSIRDFGVIDRDAHSRGEEHRSTTGCFNLSTTDTWGWMDLCCGGCPVHPRTSSSTLGLYPRDASIKPHLPLSCDN